MKLVKASKSPVGLDLPERVSAGQIDGARPRDVRDVRATHPDIRRLAALVIYDAQEELKALAPSELNETSSAWRFFFSREGTSTLPLWCYLIEMDPETVRERVLGDRRARPRRRRT